MAARSEAWRSATRGPAVSSRSRWSRPDSNPSRPSTANRAAASSMASAMPSSARHRAATRTGSGGVGSPVAAATRAANRSTASPPPPMTDNPGTTYNRSYGSRSLVRLVVRTVTSGHPVMIRSAQARTPSRTCSQLSMTSSASLAASEATSARSTEMVRCSGTPTVSATAAVTIAGSVTWIRSTNHTPSRRAGATSAATLIASRVLPMPPGPVAVTRRCSARAAVSAARSPVRPINGVTGTGRARLPDLTSRPGIASACRAKLRRSGSCSFRSIAETWLSTVRVEMNSASAICAFVMCRATRARISASRAVTSAPLTGPAVVTPSSVPPAVRIEYGCPDVVVRIAGYGWDLARLRRHLPELSSAMSAELELLAKQMSNAGRQPMITKEPALRRVPGERVDLGNLLRVEGELHQVEVGGDPLRVDRLRDHRDPMLQVPAQHHLRGRDAVGLGDVHQHRIGQVGPLERAIPLHRDAALGVRGKQGGVVPGRAPRDLVDRGGLAGHLGQPVDLGERVVAHPYRAHPALAPQVQQFLPDMAELAARRRPVHQPQVHVVGAERPQAGGQRGALPVGAAGRQLGGEEHRVPVQPALGQGVSDLALVAVHGRGVDVPVAGLQRGEHRLASRPAAQLPSPEPDHWHLDAAGQRACRYCHRLSHETQCALRPRRHTRRVPVRAVRSAKRSISRPVTGPGLPSPITRPSISRTGTRPPIVPVTNTSSAL